MITKTKHWYSIKRKIPNGIYQPLLSGYYHVRGLMHKGDEVHCPVCERDFDGFIGGHSCPSCGSGRRHRLLYLYLRNETNFFTDNIRVLHFAPEHCFFKRFQQIPNLDYLSADLDSPRAMIKVDMTDIQFPDDYFDVVISSHVLEHVPDDMKAMKELCRVMKKNGWAIHQAPVDYSRAATFEDSSIVTNADRLKFYGHIDHKRIYGRDYAKRLQAVGFGVKEIDYTSKFSEDIIRKLGLQKGELIYHVVKQTR